MIINKSSICEEFFDLSAKIAGEILQKLINYQKRIAIIGDFSIYKSKSLKDLFMNVIKEKMYIYVSVTAKVRNNYIVN